MQRLVLDVSHPLLELCPALGEGLLCGMAGRDVDHVALRVERIPGLVAHPDGDVVHPHDPAVARDHPVLPVEHVAGAVHLRELAEDVVAVVGMEHLAEEVRVGHPLLGRVAGELLDLRADVEGALGVEALDVGDERELFDHALVPGACLGQRLLGDAAIGHVLAHADDAPRRAVGVVQDRGDGRAPAHLAARKHDAELRLVPAALRRRPREPGEELLAVVGVHQLDHHVAAAVELARRQPVDRLELGRHLPPVRSQIPLERAHAGSGHREPELFLARPGEPAAAGKAGQPAAHAGAHAELEPPAHSHARVIGRKRPLVEASGAIITPNVGRHETLASGVDVSRSPASARDTAVGLQTRYPHRIFSGGRPGPRKLGAPVGGRGLRVPSQLRVPGAHDARRCHRAPRRARRRREGAGRRPEPHPAHETAVRGAGGAHRHQRRHRPRRRDRVRSRRHRDRRAGPPQGLRTVRASARALCDPRACGAADLRPDRAKPRDGVRLARARRPAGRLGVGAARGWRGGRDPRTGRRVPHEHHRRSARRAVHDDARAERDHHRGTGPRPGGPRRRDVPEARAQDRRLRDGRCRGARRALERDDRQGRHCPHGRRSHQHARAGRRGGARRARSGRGRDQGGGEAGGRGCPAPRRRARDGRLQAERRPCLHRAWSAPGGCRGPGRPGRG